LQGKIAPRIYLTDHRGGKKGLGNGRRGMAGRSSEVRRAKNTTRNGMPQNLRDGFGCDVGQERKSTARNGLCPQRKKGADTRQEPPT